MKFASQPARDFRDQIAVDRVPQPMLTGAQSREVRNASGDHAGAELKTVVESPQFAANVSDMPLVRSTPSRRVGELGKEIRTVTPSSTTEKLPRPLEVSRDYNTSAPPQVDSVRPSISHVGYLGGDEAAQRNGAPSSSIPASETRPVYNLNASQAFSDSENSHGIPEIAGATDTFASRPQNSGVDKVPTSSTERLEPAQTILSESERVAILAKVQGERSARAAIARQAIRAPGNTATGLAGTASVQSRLGRHDPPHRPTAEAAVNRAAPPTSSTRGRTSKAEIEQIATSASLAYIDQITQPAFKKRMAVRMDGREVGAVPFQVNGDRTISVHLGQVLDLFEDRFDPTEFAGLRNAKASEEFVTLKQLVSAGIELRYDPVYDEIVVST
ncbi:hypothetical protein [Erythrobacter sp. SD-21]|uniref:hypothetical protein n=1 Tax=Erythrobacter sp. SD-21 TaxID=161528 RepID=UPI0012EAEA14|nr:hypothetical protein [Erythrobacter sp. SD-21]